AQGAQDGNGGLTLGVGAALGAPTPRRLPVPDLAPPRAMVPCHGLELPLGWRSFLFFSFVFVCSRTLLLFMMIMYLHVLVTISILATRRDALLSLTRPSCQIEDRIQVLASPLHPDWVGFSPDEVDILKAFYPKRSYYGAPDYHCSRCHASFWWRERVKSQSAITKRRVVYNNCCKAGKLLLPICNCCLPCLRNRDCLFRELLLRSRTCILFQLSANIFMETLLFGNKVIKFIQA
ncbi:hypothetical protein ZWY2020_032549, partial [Hordeum vulgare]